MREFLKGLELDQDTIDTIMAEHGKLVTGFKETAETAKTELAKRANISPEDLTALKTSVTELQGKLKAFDGVDVEALTAKLTEAESKLLEAETVHGTKLAELEADALLRESLAQIGFSSGYAKKGIYEDIKSRVKYEGNALVGFDEALAELREQQPKAFAEEKKPKDEGAPHSGGKEPPKKEIPLLI
jgi:Phage minor structural protein GP20.